MIVELREYRSSDKQHIVEFMEESQDYLVSVDHMKRLRRMPEYGKSYTQRLFEKVDKNDGIAYVAEHEGRLVGFIAGLIHAQSREDLLECVPSKDGVILELFVEAEHRRRGIGVTLMERMEEYFRQKGCSISRIEVFEPNVNAHNLYRKLGYTDRLIHMIRRL
jgi:GNAT superfamily N-acetyltransferase